MSVFAGEVLQKDFRKMLTVSLVFHLLIFLPLFVVSMKRSTIIIYSPVYTVDLVEAPSKKKRAGSGATAVKRSEAAKKKAKTQQRKKEMEALQKKLATLQKRKVMDEQRAMAELQARVEALRAKKSKEILDERVKKIEENLKEREKTEKLIEDIQKKIAALKVSRDSGGKEAPGGEREKKAWGGMSGRETLLMSPEVKAYLNALDETVRSAWSVPRALLDNREDLMVQLKITIEEDGGVSSIIVERPSGKRLFDESVLRAINKAAPLPVPPEPLREGKDYYDVGFRFHYFPGNRNEG